MEPKESKNVRPRSVPDPHDQNKASKLQIFLACLKTLWEEFYPSQTERLSRIAAEMGMPPNQIADVLQEVWLDAAKHHEGFRGEGAEERLSSWLDTVVRSKSRDVLRRLGRRREESLDNLPAETMDRTAKEPAELMETKERDENLAAHLEELRKENPLNCRLVCAHFLEGRSIQDLASEVHLGVNAISCRINRALKRLRYRLRE
jgi:RNA polymerase sigma factor (sigma-70 family)